MKLPKLPDSHESSLKRREVRGEQGYYNRTIGGLAGPNQWAGAFEKPASDGSSVQLELDRSS